MLDSRGGADIVLRMHDRDSFANGLDDIIAKPLLEMRAEFERDISWNDWKGHGHCAREEWAYVIGAARTTPGCPMGTRDAGDHHGKRPRTCTDCTRAR